MKNLVGIVAGSRSDLVTMKLAQDVLAELDVPSEITVLADHLDPIEKLYLYARTAERRGLEVIITGGSSMPCPVPVFASLTMVPVIHVPIPASDNNETSFPLVFTDFGNVRLSLVATEPGDAHVAGLWAAQILAAKHWPVYHSLQKRKAGS
ncbi:MAG: AIR carboxylase family protein [Bacillota bacterium]